MGELYNVVCERRTYSDRPLVHEHVHAQLILPVKGTLSIALGEDNIEDIASEVIFIPPLFPHSFYAVDYNQFLVFDIPGTFFSCRETEYSKTYVFDKRWEAIRTLVLSEVGDSGQLANQRIADLFRYMISLLEIRARTASLDYIHQYYHTKLSIRELANIEHYNESYYCEWFYRQVGQTPMDYVRALRLCKAKQMLEDSEYSILHIAQEVGYENQATLTKLFRKYMSMTPTEFRHKSRNKEK